MTKFRSLLLLAAIAAPGTLEAQGPPRVVGITAVPNLRAQNPFTCATAFCGAVPMGAPVAPLAGGTAHDAADGATWITNGVVLAKVDFRACAVRCAPQPMPMPPGATFATGLAYDEQTRTLYATYDNNVIAWFGQPATAVCVLAPIAFCVPPIAAGHMLSGIATDDLGGNIFYASSPAPGGPAFGMVYQAPLAAPCAPFCRFPIPGCGGLLLPQITGLGWESCRRILYSTDGPTVVGVTLQPNCQVQPVSCCPGPAAAPYAGLCVLPTDNVPLGPNCTQGVCPVCPTMRHDTIGDPVIGNPTFALTLQNAPANSVAILVLSFGNYCAGPGLPLFFCSPLLTPLPVATFGGFPTGPGVGCSGGVVFPLGIPANPALCGMPMSSQWVGICPGNPLIDNFTTNCLSWTITGS